MVPNIQYISFGCFVAYLREVKGKFLKDSLPSKHKFSKIYIVWIIVNLFYFSLFIQSFHVKKIGILFPGNH